MIKIINTKTVQILIYLNKNKPSHISKLAKELGMIRSYLYLKLNLLEEQGLIYFNNLNKDKRLKTPKLTEKGVEVVKLLNKIKELIE